MAITFFISTSDCLGEDAHAFLQSQNPTELDRFILDGMKEAKVPGLAAAVGKKDKPVRYSSVRRARPFICLPTKFPDLSDEILFNISFPH